MAAAMNLKLGKARTLRFNEPFQHLRYYDMSKVVRKTHIHKFVAIVSKVHGKRIGTFFDETFKYMFEKKNSKRYFLRGCFSEYSNTYHNKLMIPPLARLECINLFNMLQHVYNYNAVSWNYEPTVPQRELLCRAMSYFKALIGNTAESDYVSLYENNKFDYSAVPLPPSPKKEVPFGKKKELDHKKKIKGEDHSVRYKTIPLRRKQKLSKLQTDMLEEDFVLSGTI
jgi:hypothetical protein